MPKRGMSAGWAWNPDSDTSKAIARGKRKHTRGTRRRHKAIMEETTMAKRKTKSAKAATNGATKGKVALKAILPKGMEAKKARRILRKSGLPHELGGRWEFTKVQATKAKAELNA